MFRIVSDAADTLAAVQALEPLVEVREILRVPPVNLHTIPGIPSASFPFTTDIPFLDRWGVPLLFGPGSFLVAHTDDEHLELSAFEQAIKTYRLLVTALSG